MFNLSRMSNDKDYYIEVKEEIKEQFKHNYSSRKEIVQVELNR